jgi:hypothetical protein
MMRRRRLDGEFTVRAGAETGTLDRTEARRTARVEKAGAEEDGAKRMPKEAVTKVITTVWIRDRWVCLTPGWLT